MCSNQKGRQLSAFLLLEPPSGTSSFQRTPHSPQRRAPGTLSPPGNVEHQLDDGRASAHPPRLPRNTALPGNAEPSGNVEPPGNVEHQLEGADSSSLSAAYLSANPSPCPHSTTASPQPASPAPPLPDWNECSALPQPDDAHR